MGATLSRTKVVIAIRSIAFVSYSTCESDLPRRRVVTFDCSTADPNAGQQIYTRAGSEDLQLLDDLPLGEG